MGIENSNETFKEEWPADGIENVPACPVCNSTERQVLHADLTDRIFFCAPGKWTLYLCLGCRSAYLDPRPSQSTIHRAYQAYYTHQNTARGNVGELGFRRRLMRMFGNGYRNWRYGTHFKPTSQIGALLFQFLPTSRLNFDRQMRYLPKLPEGGRLLDLGFGSGAFLELAREGGWDVTGADPDPVVVSAARARGLNVREGGIEAFADQPGSFDAVTLSHVIEHVFDPRSMLHAAYNALKPGGTLWICTPNLAGPVHRHFGRNWRGLEPPRHLVIFNRASLMECAASSGFTDFVDLPYAPIVELRFLSSTAVVRGNPAAVDPGELPVSDREAIKAMELAAKLSPDERDDIMFTCRKPQA